MCVYIIYMYTNVCTLYYIHLLGLFLNAYLLIYLFINPFLEIHALNLLFFNIYFSIFIDSFIFPRRFSAT